MKKIVCFVLALLLFCLPVFAEEPPSIAPVSEKSASFTPLQTAIETDASSVILIEACTGAVLYEKDADTPLPPASVTKVMTMLLIFEAIDGGILNRTDVIRISETAAEMGGSQIYLAPGEEMSVDDLLKGLIVASANDAAVALASLPSESLTETFVSEIDLVNVIISSPFDAKRSFTPCSMYSFGSPKYGRAAPNKTILAVRSEPACFASASTSIRTWFLCFFISLIISSAFG